MKQQNNYLFISGVNHLCNQCTIIWNYVCRVYWRGWLVSTRKGTEQRWQWMAWTSTSTRIRLLLYLDTMGQGRRLPCPFLLVSVWSLFHRTWAVATITSYCWALHSVDTCTCIFIHHIHTVGLYTPTDGTAIINGHDIRTNMQQIRKSLGICPQHDVLFGRLTVEEHLKLFGRIKVGGAYTHVK